MNMNELQERITEVNTANGWRSEHTPEQATAAQQIARLALIITEVTEAIEEIRLGRAVTDVYYSEGGKPEGVPSELADVVIRAFDAAGEWGVDLDAAIEEKLAYNASRGHRHGNKLA